MNNKKLLQILLVAVIAVWVFCLSLAVGIKLARKNTAESTSSVTQTATVNYLESYFSDIASSTAATTAAPQSVPTVSINGNVVTTSENVGDPAWLISEQNSKKAEQVIESRQESRKVSEAESRKEAKKIPKSKKDIAKAYCDAVNSLKAAQNFKLTKTDVLDVQIDEMSPSTISGIAQKLIQGNTKDAPASYSFVGGIDSATGKSPTQVIAPFNLSAAIDPSIIREASSVASSGGGYTVKMTLKQEQQTLTSPAKNHQTSMEVIDIATLGIPSTAKVTALTITYDYSTIEATVNAAGQLISIKHDLIVTNAVGEGSMVLPVNVTLHGNYRSDYVINY